MIRARKDEAGGWRAFPGCVDSLALFRSVAPLDLIVFEVNVIMEIF